MSPIFIRSPGEMFAIAGGVKIGVPRFAEGIVAPLPKMSQVARRQLQDLSSIN